MITNNSVEFERQLIGCILKDPTHIKCREILDSISVEDFSDYERAGIFAALKKMSEAKKNIDPMLVDEYLISIGFQYSGLIILFEMIKEVFLRECLTHMLEFPSHFLEVLFLKVFFIT